MGLTGIIGGMRKGKTLLAVIMCYETYLKHRQVKSNLSLHFPHVSKSPRTKRFTLMELIRFMDKESVWQNLTVLWDEIYLNLEARLSASQELNRIASYFIFQSGKRDIDVIWTSQRFGNPDNRLRWATLEVGELVKATGVFVLCLRRNRLIDATICWKTNCKYLNHCKRISNFYARYKVWNGQRWRSFRINKVQQFYDFYKTEYVISYAETMRVQAYLQAQRRALRKAYRKKLDAVLEKETTDAFLRELEDVL